MHMPVPAPCYDCLMSGTTRPAVYSMKEPNGNGRPLCSLCANKNAMVLVLMKDTVFFAGEELRPLLPLVNDE